jgi:hypothetical protein
LNEVVRIVVNDLQYFNQEADKEGLLAMLLNWQDFCASRQVHIDYDERTQLGVYATVQIDAQATISFGALRKVLIGARSHAPIRCGHKWSSVHNYAICGPYSMLNHACRHHANVDTDFDSCELWTIRSIAQSEELLIEYADDEYLKRLGTGIECWKCIDGEYDKL